MSTKKDSELTEEMFVGHRAQIRFRTPAETETDKRSLKVSEVWAELTSYVPGVAFSLSDITAAFDEAGNDISKELLGSAMMGHPFNIASLASPKPVV